MFRDKGTRNIETSVICRHHTVIIKNCVSCLIKRHYLDRGDCFQVDDDRQAHFELYDMVLSVEVTPICPVLEGCDKSRSYEEDDRRGCFSTLSKLRFGAGGSYGYLKDSA